MSTNTIVDYSKPLIAVSSRAPVHYLTPMTPSRSGAEVLHAVQLGNDDNAVLLVDSLGRGLPDRNPVVTNVPKANANMTGRAQIDPVIDTLAEELADLRDEITKAAQLARKLSHEQQTALLAFASAAAERLEVVISSAAKLFAEEITAGLQLAAEIQPVKSKPSRSKGPGIWPPATDSPEDEVDKKLAEYTNMPTARLSAFALLRLARDPRAEMPRQTTREGRTLTYYRKFRPHHPVGVELRKRRPDWFLKPAKSEQH